MTIACLTGYHPSNSAPGNNKCPPGPGGATNRCVFGYCASAPDVGCNPGDPANVVGCGECKRAGNCFSLNEPQPGLFVATTSCAGAPASPRAVATRPATAPVRPSRPPACAGTARTSADASWRWLRPPSRQAATTPRWKHRGSTCHTRTARSSSGRIAPCCPRSFRTRAGSR